MGDRNSPSLLILPGPLSPSILPIKHIQNVAVRVMGLYPIGYDPQERVGIDPHFPISEYCPLDLFLQW